MKLRAYGTTDVGLVRHVNEDAYYVADAGPDRKLALVADGLGGHNAGEVASALAVDEFRRQVESGHFATANHRRLQGDVLNVVARRAHAAIGEASRREAGHRGMGTTLTAALIEPAGGVLVQVGDSRCYLWHDGAARQLSTDQTIARELLDSGRIDEQHYATHPDRNRLSQCLGLEDVFNPLEPVIAPFDWSPGQRLLLCSDGLTDMVDDATISRLMAIGPLEEAAQALVKAALEAGGRDNVTTVLVANEDAPSSSRLEAGKTTSLSSLWQRWRRVWGARR